MNSFNGLNLCRNQRERGKRSGTRKKAGPGISCLLAEEADLLESVHLERGEKGT